MANGERYIAHWINKNQKHTKYKTLKNNNYFVSCKFCVCERIILIDKKLE